MSKINVLSSKIFNRIAAGEVVDRPYSVVKELIENSIDSGATEITIEITNGGINSITIIDNGCGIEKDDLKIALMPHATSKISKISDLDNITSLGFRGEALPSIASVSKLTIQSKTKEQVLGAKIYCEGGKIIEHSDCGLSDGTIVTVNNLFYNTPVREKFLRSARSEEGEITSTISRFILGNPNIAFKYYADNKLVYQSFGDGLESAMVNVYGASIINDCFFISTEKNGLIINGYIGKHNFTKGNRTHQTIFINGRYVVNQTISSSINNAYSSYLMKHRYPFYVLNITLPTSIVDVNVHPNKLDVRFSNNQIVYSSLYSVISKVLDGSSEALNIIKDNSKNLSKDIIDNNVTHNNDFPKYPSVKLNKLIFNDSGAKSVSYKEISKNDKPLTIDVFEENRAYLLRLEQERQNQSALINEDVNLKQSVKQEAISIKRQLSYVGQVLNTYIVLEDGLDIYFVDQHAAHERILYDKLIEQVNNEEVVKQPLLIPYILNVNNDEYEFLYNNVNNFSLLGIDLEVFGNDAFKVSCVPAFLSEINLEELFKDVLNDLFILKSITISNVLNEKIAQKACKSAIKSGNKIDTTQVDVIVKKLNENIGLKCPHGRPVAVKISRTEIDKWFKRIL